MTELQLIEMERKAQKIRLFFENLALTTSNPITREAMFDYSRHVGLMIEHVHDLQVKLTRTTRYYALLEAATPDN